MMSLRAKLSNLGQSLEVLSKAKSKRFFVEKKAKKMKILVSDPLGKAGMDELKKEKDFVVEEKTGLPPEQLKKIIGDYEAIIIRSGTKLTKDILTAAKKLRVIGRAGVGVDNVHLETATAKGIIVMNTPEGNTISTAEHTFSMLMSLARNIPQANQSMRQGEWDRHKFLGTELHGKTLAVIGFGRIGREVMKRAIAFGMKVVIFDPFVTKDSIKDFPVDFLELKSLLKIADFITVHTPLTPETKYILNAETFKLCKTGVKVINCARGGIIEEKALYEAIKSGKVSGAALDVFEDEPPVNNPLLELPQVISTPHLGAATQEAQENVAIDVVKQVLDALHERAIKNAVNLPNLDPETYSVLKPWITLSEKIGMLYSQLFGGGIQTVTVRYGGVLTKYNLKPLTIAMLKGLLTPICGETVNFVNAPAIAQERGMAVNENRSTEKEDFTNYIEVIVNDEKSSKSGPNRIMGALFGEQFPRIVRVNEFRLEMAPEGIALFIHNEDRPGVVGNLGRILGDNHINIAEMSLGRIKKGSKTMAMTVIMTDNDVSASVLKEIKKFSPILDAKVVKL
ncbi:MAG: phosphoglycerate dehydrogenase [Candidatus Omnitrophica bacterium]|nr:phosphoglycerate dehydrogenase [Candidatus Omnitrophota bacterium]